METDKINWNFINWYQHIRNKYPMDNSISIARYKHLKKTSTWLLKKEETTIKLLNI